MENSFFDFSAPTSVDGKSIKTLCEGKKAVLVVNVASRWGLTKKNYDELVQIYTDYADKGL